MVDLDSSHDTPVSVSLSEEETYNVMEGFLFQNLVLFALRKGYFQGADAICRGFGRNYRLPALAKWCLCTVRVLNAITSDGDNVGNVNTLTPTTEEQRVMLGVLLDVAVELVEQLNSSSYRSALNEFVEKARRLVVHMHLEQFAVNNDYAVFLAQLNQHFPASSTSSTVRSYRLTFSKLLLSPSRVQKYLRERWLPNRIEAVKSLASTISEVTRQLPEVLLDYLNTETWPDIEKILLELNTGLAFAVREYFHTRTECVEHDLIQLARFCNTQTLPSQMF